MFEVELFLKGLLLQLASSMTFMNFVYYLHGKPCFICLATYDAFPSNFVISVYS